MPTTWLMPNISMSCEEACVEGINLPKSKPCCMHESPNLLKQFWIFSTTLTTCLSQHHLSSISVDNTKTRASILLESVWYTAIESQIQFPYEEFFCPPHQIRFIQNNMHYHPRNWTRLVVHIKGQSTPKLIRSTIKSQTSRGKIITHKQKIVQIM